MNSLVFFGITFLVSTTTFANPKYNSDFKKTYPNTTVVTTFRCVVCHDVRPPALNPYGSDLQKAGGDFKSIDNADSDGDGIKNIDEINGGTNPGDAKSHASYTLD